MNRFLIGFALIPMFFSTAVLAQPRGQASSRIPSVGTQLPDVTAYDAAGDKFSTSSLRGSYSVLVFGCLT